LFWKVSADKQLLGGQIHAQVTLHDVCYVTPNLLCICVTQGSWPRHSMRLEDVTCPWWTLNLQPDEPPTTSGELQHMYNQNPGSIVEYPITNSLSLSAGKQTLTSPVLPQFVFTLMTWWVLPNTHTHTHTHRHTHTYLVYYPCGDSI